MVNRTSSTLYSGMVPGLIAGNYCLSEVLINLRVLVEKAGVALVIAEIKGLNAEENIIELTDRPPINYTRMSIDVGSETCKSKESSSCSKT